MIYYINANLLDSDCNYICHQVNCQGKMASGVAGQIRKRWPEVYTNYMTQYAQAKTWADCCENNGEKATTGDYLLGDVQFVYLEDANIPRQCVVNLFAQDTFGYNGNRYTSYDAFWNCLNVLKNKIPKGATIAFPYKIGCGLGGANWEIIEKMIDIVFKDYEVFIYKLED